MSYQRQKSDSCTVLLFYSYVLQKLKKLKCKKKKTFAFIKFFSYNFSRPVPVRTTDEREIRFQTSAYDFIVCCTNPTSDFLFFGHH